MANSEYLKTGKGNFAAAVAWPADAGYLGTAITYEAENLPFPITAGMAAMVDDEIMRIDAVVGSTLTVKRGCADTIPAPHTHGTVMWIFDVSSAGQDGVEHSASEVIGVKVAPYTSGGGMVDIATVAPQAVDFDWRFIRPYLPGNLIINTNKWFQPPGMDDTTPMLYFTWNHRDRVLQADQLVGHEDPPIGPEPGTVYNLRFYNNSGGMIREELGIVGNSFTYPRAHAMYDYGRPTANVTGQFTLHASRDGHDSYQYYFGTFVLVPGGALEVEYLPFAKVIMEAPYIVNLLNFKVQPDEHYAVGMAARPGDRSVHLHDLWSNQIVTSQYTKQVNKQSFTPWITTDFRLPELETEITVRTSSLYDGVRVDGLPVGVGQLALIGSELVEILYATNKKFIVRRGCCDTIPQVHIAGSRLWLFGARATHDPHQRAEGLDVAYLFVPDTYGDERNPNNINMEPDLQMLLFKNRARRPYPPGRVVVNGRPWFEEASATSGVPTLFTWARRNRLTLGTMVVGHDHADYGLENGQVTRIRFFYYHPPVNGSDNTVLREANMAGNSYSYAYEDAVADGLVAGQALGICGTVVIHARLYSVRDGIESWQSYYTPIRVPSYPCV